MAAPSTAPNEPSYMVVNKQLKDVIRIQNTGIARLIAMSKSHKEDLLPREEYDRLARQLEEETLEHVKTKAKLAGEKEKLEFALGEIDILTKQLQREKAAFEKAFGNLKNRAQMESEEKGDLLNKCEELEVICHRQDDILSTKDSKIRDLKTRLTKQKQTHKQRLSELEIQKEQERYIIMNTLPTKDASKKLRKKVTFR